jgi:hypothetical protein
MSKPLKFNLQNGLAATLYPAGNPAMKHLLNYRNQNRVRLKPGETTVVKVDVDGEPLCLAYRTRCHPNNELVEALSTDLKLTLAFQNCFIIYDHFAHGYAARSHYLLTRAIIQKVKPSLAALLLTRKGE